MRKRCALGLGVLSTVFFSIFGTACTTTEERKDGRSSPANAPTDPHAMEIRPAGATAEEDGYSTDVKVTGKTRRVDVRHEDCEDPDKNFDRRPEERPAGSEVGIAKPVGKGKTKPFVGYVCP